MSTDLLFHCLFVFTLSCAAGKKRTEFVSERIQTGEAYGFQIAFSVHSHRRNPHACRCLRRGSTALLPEQTPLIANRRGATRGDVATCSVCASAAMQSFTEAKRCENSASRRPGQVRVFSAGAASLSRGYGFHLQP